MKLLRSSTAAWPRVSEKPKHVASNQHMALPRKGNHSETVEPLPCAQTQHPAWRIAGRRLSCPDDIATVRRQGSEGHDTHAAEDATEIPHSSGLLRTSSSSSSSLSRDSSCSASSPPRESEARHRQAKDSKRFVTALFPRAASLGDSSTEASSTPASPEKFSGKHWNRILTRKWSGPSRTSAIGHSGPARVAPEAGGDSKDKEGNRRTCKAFKWARSRTVSTASDSLSDLSCESSSTSSTCDAVPCDASLSPPGPVLAPAAPPNRTASWSPCGKKKRRSSSRSPRKGFMGSAATHHLPELCPSATCSDVHSSSGAGSFFPTSSSASGEPRKSLGKDITKAASVAAGWGYSSIPTTVGFNGSDALLLHFLLASFLACVAVFPPRHLTELPHTWRVFIGLSLILVSVASFVLWLTTALPAQSTDGEVKSASEVAVTSAVPANTAIPPQDAPKTVSTALYALNAAHAFLESLVSAPKQEMASVGGACSNNLQAPTKSEGEVTSNPETTAPPASVLASSDSLAVPLLLAVFGVALVAGASPSRVALVLLVCGSLVKALASIGLKKVDGKTVWWRWVASALKAREECEVLKRMHLYKERGDAHTHPIY
eukprot:TRINITY_DN13935_c0_g1_i3.p1 TRINITY_DN13935_c0_g1~~TRINITY_DN13935_c0_g1_i3.p1  ORF type:complete len:603 (+),score=17.03 TRINITY_DN13935_c0_g1_i3:199-2007(+)